MPDVLIAPSRRRPYKPCSNPHVSYHTLPSVRALHSSLSIIPLIRRRWCLTQLCRAIYPFDEVFNRDTNRLHEKKSHGRVALEIDTCGSVDERMDDAGKKKGRKYAYISRYKCALSETKHIIREEVCCAEKWIAKTAVPKHTTNHISSHRVKRAVVMCKTYAQNFRSVNVSVTLPKYGGQSPGSVRKVATPMTLVAL